MHAVIILIIEIVIIAIIFYVRWKILDREIEEAFVHCRGSIANFMDVLERRKGMDDTISRKATYDKIDKYFGDLPIVVHHDMLQIIKDMPSAQQWIHVKYRPMDDEERKDYEETFGPLADDEAVMFDCKMPQDGQEVWVCSKCGDVWQDTCQSDEGIYLENNGDWLDIVAWMPYIRPEPWKGENNG